MADKPENEKILQWENAFITDFEEAMRKVGLKVGASHGLMAMLNFLPAFLKTMLVKGAQLGISALNIPRHLIPVEGTIGDTVHEYLVEGMRAFAGGLHEGLQDVNTLTSDELEAKIAGAVKKADDLLKQKVRFVGAIEYVPSDCPHHARPFAPKGQKAPEDMERADAIKRGGRPANCGCYGDLLVDLDKRPKKEEAKPAAPFKSLVELKEELKQTDEALANDFWVHYREADDVLKHKFLAIFGPGKDGSLGKLRIIAEHPHTEWNDVLNALLGNHSNDNIKRVILEKLERIGEKVAGRAKSEEAELNSIVPRIGSAIREADDALHDRILELEVQRDLRREEKTAREEDSRRDRRFFRNAFLAMAAIAAIVTTIVVIFGR